MEILPAEFITLKNRMSSDEAILVTCEIPTYSIYLVNNTEDVVYNAQTYTKFAFEVDLTKQVSKGDINTIALRVANQLRTIQAYIEDYDGMIDESITIRVIARQLSTIDQVIGTDSKNYTCILSHTSGNSSKPITGGSYATYWREGGSSGAAWVTSTAYSSGDYLLVRSWTYDILACSADVNWVTFTLGAPNPLNKRFPLYRYIANHCNWTFNSPAVRAAGTNAGAECGYAGADTTCKRTLADCQSKSNSARFGGYVGMGSGNVRLA